MRMENTPAGWLPIFNTLLQEPAVFATIGGAVVNFDFGLESSGAGYIALEVGTGCTYRSGGQGINRRGEGGDIEAEEDGIVCRWVGVTELSFKLSESVASPSSLL